MEKLYQYSRNSRVDGVEIDDNAIEVVRYDIQGCLLTKPSQGINIVKMNNGTTRKEVVN